MKAIFIKKNEHVRLNRSESERKFAVFCNKSVFFAFVAHILLIPIFFLLGNSYVLASDLIAVVLDLFCLRLIKKDFIRMSSLIWVLEITVLSSICAFVFGWGQGHYYYLFSLIPVVFFSRWPQFLRIIISAFLFSVTLYLYYYTHMYPPITVLTPFMATFMYVFNVTVNFIGLAYASYYYRQYSERLEQKLQKLANTDDLTGIRNRRCFERTAKSQLEHYRGHETQCALIYFDLDHFKRINDTYGHAAGDRALKAVSDACQQVLRKEDLFARIGGEEFAVLLVNTTHTEAAQVAERLRKCIASCSLVLEDGTQLYLSASVGLAAPQTDDDKLSQLMAHSDLALYQAKRGGRNQVVSLI